ncbi:putative phage abortive infection protein [Fluviicola taffensis]|uniref:Phage abortive infection protein n=1 Tax=Fluviicola taffensis (strain DSM 16823 / NCIMB 13979 / RW262) TaxID=755732 RepID=F2IDF3_FLUTR|nr:putative phage abortive infection protein [Fluviicola taffensis]AEA42329.1 hypothetical protein Fluta_0320 [Fluviicola taffensis DSM 16823]
MSNNELLIISILFFGLGLYLFLQTRNISKQFKKSEDKKDYSNIIMMILLIIIGILFIPWIFSNSIFNSYGKSNEIGDTIGGITAPFINGLSAVLVYLAFNAQVEANKLVNDQFQLQQIESRFFELLKLHRDNVAEIGIGDSYGKKIFVTLIREFRLIHIKLQKINLEERINLNSRQLMEVSYLILFFGFGPNSSRQLEIALNHYNKTGLFDLLKLKFDNKDLKLVAMKERKLQYTPFEGHQSRLGHYFRHLYQTVDFIHEKKIDIDKYSYVKALRAQLTTHEQALLYINSLTQLGNRWWTKDYLIKYKMIKNIPPGFFNPETEFFRESDFPEKYFEHQLD